MIRDRIICGISDHVTHKRLLRTKELDLKTCADYCKAAETLKVQAHQITSSSAAESTGVNAVSTKKGSKYTEKIINLSKWCLKQQVSKLANLNAIFFWMIAKC